MSLEKFLEDLADSSIPLVNSNFIEVSDLSPAELGIFARAWFRLSLERRRDIMSTMVELAEDGTELDFCTIFKMCLKDPDEWVQEKAIEGLWEYEDRSVIPGLIQVLGSDKSSKVRAAAAVALGKFAVLAQEGNLLHKDAITVRDNLMAVLQNSAENADVRRRSLEAVAPFNTPDIKDYVCWAYQSDDLKLKVQLHLRDGTHRRGQLAAPAHRGTAKPGAGPALRNGQRLWRVGRRRGGAPPDLPAAR